MCSSPQKGNYQQISEDLQTEWQHMTPVNEPSIGWSPLEEKWAQFKRFYNTNLSKHVPNRKIHSETQMAGTFGRQTEKDKQSKWRSHMGNGLMKI